MKAITRLARKSLRYKRKDISVHVCQNGRKFKYVELLNISQSGMLIRGQINLKNCVLSKISFNKKNVFEQKGTVVRKVKSVESLPAKKAWFFFSKDKSVYEYGLAFEGDASAFKHFLLLSNMKMRLEFHGH